MEGLFVVIFAHWASGKAVVCVDKDVGIAAGSQESVREIGVSITHGNGRQLGCRVSAVALRWLQFSLEQGLILDVMRVWLWKWLLCF